MSNNQNKPKGPGFSAAGKGGNKDPKKSADEETEDEDDGPAWKDEPAKVTEEKKPDPPKSQAGATKKPRPEDVPSKMRKHL